MSDSSERRALFGELPIHVEDAGAGVPVVLVHSSGMSGEQWRRTSQDLALRGYRTIVPDLLGAGRSQPWPEGKPFTFEDDVAVLARLLAMVDDPIHLVGHSYGGLIALRAALLQSERLLSLSVYDPVTFGVLDLANDAVAREDLARVGADWGSTAEDHRAWLEGFVDYWGGAGAWSKLRESARAEFARVGWVVHEGVRTLVGDTTSAEAYAVIRAPMLLMTGELTPPAAAHVIERLAKAIPNAKVARFEGAGHMGPLTHVTRMIAELVAHFEAAPR